MHQKTINILSKWLAKSGYSIQTLDLQRRFLSHPDAGTLGSITDTLHDFNINNQAIQINVDSIFELTEPFIAFVQNRGYEEFVLVNPIANEKFEIFNGNEKTFNISSIELKKVFNGIIVAIDKQEKTTDKRKKHFVKPIFFVSLSALISCIFWNHAPVGITRWIYFITSSLGFICSVLLLIHSLGTGNILIKRFCAASKHTDCSIILQSDAAKIGKVFTLTDAGIIYFSFQLLYLLFGFENTMALNIMSIFAATFPFYSIYQQAIIIKKWCPLCLGVISMLILQAIWAITQIGNFSFDLHTFIAAFSILLTVTICWYYLKEVSVKKTNLHEVETELLRFKRNYHLFLPYYKSLRPVNDRLLSSVPEIVIGKKKAPLQITLITNPICEACQKAHAIIAELLDRYPEKISTRLVFNIPYNNLDDPRTMIAAWFISSYLQNIDTGIKKIKNWYSQPDIKAFKSLNLPIDIIKSYQEYLHAHAEWCKQNNFGITPIILINNKVFPFAYQTADLHFLIEAILEYELEELENAASHVYSKTVLSNNT